jgi:hypothetical protein
MDKSRLLLTMLVLAGLGLALGACGPAETPTPVATLPRPTTAAPATAPPPVTPPPTPLPVPSSQPTPVPPCTDAAALDSEAIMPEGDLLPGQSFIKTWRLTNSGSCAWSEDYALVFVTGDRMGGAEAIPLPMAVAPGSSVELSVALTAPAGGGTYQGRWLLRNPGGGRFGVGDDAQTSLTVQITVSVTPVATPTPTPQPPTDAWRGEYYANRDLSGTPALVRDDSAIDFNWGSASPDPALPADGFSARWARKLSFDGGPYRFRALVDDGMRLWVDDVLVLDAWSNGSQREVVADYTLATGSHNLRVEYYDYGGEAVIQVSWDKITSFPDWKGEYWANTDLSGDPALIRNDTAVEFNWGTNAPAPGLPADFFSARWTRTVEFEAADYRFHVLVDDGAILYVDDSVLLDTWRDGPARELTVDCTITGGSHNVRVDYYERGGNAQVHVWWEKASPAFYDWKGEYWTNPDMSGAPVLVQNESRIDFNWGAGSAAGGLPVDDFSARWTRVANFDAGSYRFHILVDDGARLWIDDQLIINAWQDGTAREVTADHSLGRGAHELRVEYYERVGDAQMHLWWEKIQ